MVSGPGETEMMSAEMSGEDGPPRRQNPGEDVCRTLTSCRRYAKHILGMISLDPYDNPVRQLLKMQKVRCKGVKAEM